MSGVFLDTAGLLGLWDEDDPWHSAATAAFAPLRAQRERFYTTSYVLAEKQHSGQNGQKQAA